MGILQRVVDMTKAAANEMLDKVENPVVMMNHYLRDLDENIAKAEHGLVQQQVQERVLIAKHEELSSQAAHYETKAEEAASEDREAEARAALEAMLLYQSQAEETAKLVQLAKSAALDLELHIEGLKEERTRLQTKREDLIARVRRANHGAGNEYRQAGFNWPQGSASQGFERIEQKVMEMEAERDLARAYPRSAYSADIADPKQEQRNAQVEEQLQRLLQKKSGA